MIPSFHKILFLGIASAALILSPVADAASDSTFRGSETCSRSAFLTSEYMMNATYTHVQESTLGYDVQNKKDLKMLVATAQANNYTMSLYECSYQHSTGSSKKATVGAVAFCIDPTDTLTSSEVKSANCVSFASYQHEKCDSAKICESSFDNKASDSSILRNLNIHFSASCGNVDPMFPKCGLSCNAEGMISCDPPASTKTTTSAAMSAYKPSGICVAATILLATIL